MSTRDEPNEGGVARKLQEFDGRMTGGAAVGVQGEEQREKDTALRGSGADGPDLCSQLNASVIHLQVESDTLS